MVDQSYAAVDPAKRSASAFALPPLPYDSQALEPVLSQQTLELHYGKHHARYVNTLNRLLADKNMVARSLEEVIRVCQWQGEAAMFNNAAQTWNHAFFWESMRRNNAKPNGAFRDAIAASFGGFDELSKSFIAEGAAHFGSGWVWLVGHGSALSVCSTHDACTPIVEDGVTPLLTCDVWEHAYYLDYRQDRVAWLSLWWDNLANWDFAERQYRAALGEGEPWHFPEPLNM